MAQAEASETDFGKYANVRKPRNPMKRSEIPDPLCEGRKARIINACR
jgi:hypothetical protein